ncbi:methyl-accepting chemotaxis protein [Massilia putida]|uniref:methyl-accepting chemotaxis protein n=1 Tax=Massilia putida TaxID=1141883 RepID=UPI000950BFA1|nr:methyl-accepting chemotaxis protein [Massilia putida]
MTTSRFKVATLLGAGFGIACAFIAATILLGLGEQATLNRITAGIADERWPSAELATDVHVRVTDIAVALRNALLSGDAAVRRAQTDEIAQQRRAIDADLAQLQRHGGAGLERIRAALDAYTVGQDQLLALVRAGRQAEAVAYLNSDVKPMLQACRTALAERTGHEADLMNAARADAARAYASTRTNMLVLGALALAGAGAAAVLVIRRLRRDLGGEPDAAARTAARIADGDLTGAIALRPGDVGSMLAEMEHMRIRLGRLVGQVRRDGDQIAAASAQIAAGNQDLSARTERQAAGLEETAAAMEQLHATVERNRDHAGLADDLARQAVQAAQRGGAAVGVINERMDGIVAAARRMADIIGLIDGIAFQTNILALNAAVEAARAGDAGRGFAVVAAEVRQLAQRSAAAAGQIGELISSAAAQAHAGAVLVRETGAAMDDIVAGAARVEEIMRQIRTSSAEQHAGIAACSRAVVAMEQDTQQNAALVEQVAAAAAALREQADRLARAVSRFRVDDGAVRTAAPARLPRLVAEVDA